MYLTIFTPTFNRASFLQRLFLSLKTQSFDDFEWIIVDDGSTDDTAEVVSSMIEEASFPIRFFRQENQGKHVAINVGMKYATGIFFFIVDSDDYLTDNSLIRNVFYCQQIEQNNSFAGVAGMRGYDNGKPQIILPQRWRPSYHAALKAIKETFVDGSYYYLRDRLHIGGDRAEVIKTDILRQYKFPSFPGENFISEDYLWCQLAEEGYKVRWFNEVTYLGERHADGLVKNMKNICLCNPKGMACVNNLISGHHEASFFRRLRSCAAYFKYSYLSGMRLYESIENSYFKMFALPIGVLIYLVLSKTKIKSILNREQP
ncbi:glycosyltransferase family 2 protein [Bifidobacterium dentium]|uniref:glycosyltransferase family 2 protein n=1 Tax=Bifidobacterium TaxID=1678 RepID=UPI0010F5DE22|nr:MULTISPECIES: glycosyltransferase family A protein [Bifidobacterium]MBF9696805.1 glycosyltransferase family 2 protein [Bifidobacterium dentium]MBF9712965.1 glycosyltransferase family 2 protein [Bifidobacterium dentium]MBF9714926.1 glycosyltransferase family 2 protein [Bifidobacterium dentium]MBF9718903.1 glycosyltransferase family 2 protein [Bifidobacterium dentium]